MPALLATLHDLGVGLVVAVIALLLAHLATEWFRATRVTEAERYRQDPVEPMDFDGEIRAFETRRDQEVMGERRSA